MDGSGFLVRERQVKEKRSLKSPKRVAQGGFRIGTFGIEAFTDLERNISKGSTLTSQIGSYIRPAIYERGTLRVSGGVGAFLENIQPQKDLVLKNFDFPQRSDGWHSRQ